MAKKSKKTDVSVSEPATSKPATSKPATSKPATSKPATSKPASSRPTDDESIKETFESVVIAFILAFVFRAYVVEAFVIPTGSMAPTLLGEHFAIECEMCGYDYTVDGNKAKHSVYDTDFECPMCHYPSRLEFGVNGRRMTQTKSGDRILVQKYVNSMLRRFDVVVFKAPHKPFTNYIKRLIGLQGEAIQIIEGNIYVNPTPGDESGWHIARKTDPDENPHALSIQRAVWQPIYHSRYVPLDWIRPSWKREPAQVFRVPWVIEDTGVEHSWQTAKEGELDPTAGYRHESVALGRIRFDFGRSYRGGPGYFPYGMDRPAMQVEDIRLAVAFAPEQDGLQVTLRTTCRMDDKQGVMRTLFVSIDAQGNVLLGRKADVNASDVVELGSAKVEPFAANQMRHVELWYVDQEASVWVDGKRVLTKRFDLGIEYVRNRAMPCELLPSGELIRQDGGVPLSPEVVIEVSGSPVSIHRVELDRDLYYTPATETTNYRASLEKTRDDQDRLVLKGQPKILRKDEFFCMGDNSPSSHDGRSWGFYNGKREPVDYWVMKRMIAEGTPELEADGIVPARMLMGRAFFVYFPAPHAMSEESFPFIPNFGNMRFIR